MIAGPTVPEIRFRCKKCKSVFRGPANTAGVMNCPFCRGPPMDWQDSQGKWIDMEEYNQQKEAYMLLHNAVNKHKS